MNQETNDKIDEELSEIFDKLQEEEAAEATAEQDSEEIADAENNEETADTAEEETAVQSNVIKETAEDEEETAETAEDEEPEIANAPKEWTAKSKDSWSGIDKDIRREILKREGENNNAFELNQDKIRYADSIEKMVAPYMATIRANNVSPEKAIESMLDSYHRLSTASPAEKSNLLLQTAINMGADMSFFQNNQAQQAQPAQQYYEDPRVTQLINDRDSEKQKAEERLNSQNEKIAMEFLNEKDSKGVLKFPYAENVWGRLIGDLGYLRTSNPELSTRELLERAYESASWSDPETRQLLQSQNSIAESEEREKLAKAKKAKKAQKLNLDTRGSNNGKAQKLGSMDDTLNAEYDRINSG